MKEREHIAVLAGPLKRRVNLALWLDSVTGPLAFLCGAFATILILFKLVLPDLTSYAALVFLLAPLLLVYIFFRCKRSGLFFRTPEIVEIMDHRYRDDGSVTACFERPDLFSSSGLIPLLERGIKSCRLRLDPVWYFRKMLPALLFLTLAMAIPPRTTASMEQKKQILTAMTDPLFDQMEQNMDLLSEEESEEFQEILEEIKEDNKGVSREKWEAVEEVRERLDHSIREKQQNVQDMLSDMQKLEDLANQAGNKPLDDDGKNRMQELLKDLEAKSRKYPMSGKKQAELDQLMKNLKQAPNSEELKKKLSQLKKGLGTCCGREPAYQLGEKGNGAKEGPGRGGINRGRGDAPMVFGKEKDLPEAGYREKEIFNQFLTPGDIVDLGITPVEPEPDPGRFSPGTIMDFKTQDGDEVSRTRISPGQRDVVSKYFSK